MVGKLKLDEIGFWSEIKLEIIKKYANAYSTIISKKEIFEHAYIDAFAGAGMHISKKTGDWVKGSPINALQIRPPFKHYYFIDLKGEKTEFLASLVGKRKDVDIFQGDCNEILKEKVFPNIKYRDFKRALCLLDPYGLHLSWEIIKQAGNMQTIEIFLNFPVMDMNMNVLWSDQTRVDAQQAKRMTYLWGDETWKKQLFEENLNLFDEPLIQKMDARNIANVFKNRLKNEAKFKYVPDPIPVSYTHLRAHET